jgi:hypothetical protein
LNMKKTNKDSKKEEEKAAQEIFSKAKVFSG